MFYILDVTHLVLKSQSAEEARNRMLVYIFALYLLTVASQLALTRCDVIQRTYKIYLSPMQRHFLSI